MNCCHDDHGHTNGRNGKPKKHMPHWMMMIFCCGLPVALLLLLPAIGNVFPGAGGFLAVVIPFLCPLMMGMMMVGMFRKDKAADKGENRCEADENAKSLPPKARME